MVKLLAMLLGSIRSERIGSNLSGRTFADRQGGMAGHRRGTKDLS